MLWILAFLAFAGCCFLYGSYADMALVRAIHTGRNPYFDPALQWVSDATAWISFGSVAAILLYAYAPIWIPIQRLSWDPGHNRTYKLEALLLLLSLLVATLLVQSLKSLVLRPRPYEVYTFIRKLSDAGGGSFPSGHTTDAFTVLAFLMLGNYPLLLVLPVLIWAILVGYTRVTLGVHYGSDVLGAVLLGSLSAWIMRTLAGRYGLPYEKNLPR